VSTLSTSAAARIVINRLIIMLPFSSGNALGTALSRLANACIEYALSPQAALEPSCAIGVNHAEKLSANEFGSKDAPCCDLTIQNHPRAQFNKRSNASLV
jgi:hypothetical protein